jgi:hypothetical protein
MFELLRSSTVVITATTSASVIASVLPHSNSMLILRMNVLRHAHLNCSAAAQVQCTQREIIESLYVCSGCGAYLLTGSSVLLSAPDLPELSLIAPVLAAATAAAAGALGSSSSSSSGTPGGSRGSFGGTPLGSGRGDFGGGSGYVRVNSPSILVSTCKL